MYGAEYAIRLQRHAGELKREVNSFSLVQRGQGAPNFPIKVANKEISWPVSSLSKGKEFYLRLATMKEPLLSLLLDCHILIHHPRNKPSVILNINSAQLNIYCV